MKKIILYFLPFSFLLSPFILNAQYQPQLPSSDFETGWVNKTGVNGVYEEFLTEYFYTLNSLYALDNEPKPADLTAFKDMNPQQGKFAIRLVSGVVPVGEDVFLPGMVGTINEDFVKEFLGSEDGNVTVYRDWLGYDTPHALEGWFKYNPVGGDSALIDIGFYRGGDNPVFIEKLIIKETVNQWSKFSITIPKQYWNQEFTSIRVLFVASAGVNFNKLMECKGQKGSTLWIDNIYLNYGEVGIKQDIFSPLKTKVFPNPATEVLNLELNENFTGKVLVYDMLGSFIMTESIQGTQCQLNTSSLAAGNYVYKLMNENTIFAQGKFVVTK